MNKNRITFCFALVFCFLLISCKKQAPQLPSNKGEVVDEKRVELLEINQELTIQEDSILKEYAEKQDADFKKNDIGFWYKIDKRIEGPYLKEKETCKFSCKMMSLKGEVLVDEVKQAVIGKKQLVIGLEEGLKLLHKGESATFIIPSYLAYGMKGNEPLIPPYTSLICKIELFN